MLGSVGDLLGSYLEAEPLKGFLGFLGLTSVYGGPWSQGTGYVYSHHSWGEFEGRFGEFGFARGGMGAISEALAAAARARGVEIRTGAEVERITVADGRATGVVVSGGEELAADVVVSNADPAPDLPRDARRIRAAGGVRRARARDRLPRHDGPRPPRRRPAPAHLSAFRPASRRRTGR